MQAGVGLLDMDMMPIFIIMALDIIITLRFFIDCSTVIWSPTVCFLSREKPLVKPMAPGSLSYYIASYLFYIILESRQRADFWRRSFILQSLLSNLYRRNTKNIYFTIFIRSHFCE